MPLKNELKSKEREDERKIYFEAKNKLMEITRNWRIALEKTEFETLFQPVIQEQIEKMKREIEAELLDKLSIKNMNIVLTTSSYILSIFLLLFGFVASNFIFLTYGTLLFVLNCIHFISSVINDRKKSS